MKQMQNNPSKNTKVKKNSCQIVQDNFLQLLNFQMTKILNLPKHIVMAVAPSKYVDWSLGHCTQKPSSWLLYVPIGQFSHMPVLLFLAVPGGHRTVQTQQ